MSRERLRWRDPVRLASALERCARALEVLDDVYASYVTCASSFRTDYDACGLDGNFPNTCHYNLMWFEGDPGEGSCPGDSGSPFYFDLAGAEVAIRGMVVAGQRDPPYGAPCSEHYIVVIDKMVEDC